jgi:hypothetical protein
MNRNSIMTFLVFVILAGFGGCILSTNPNPVTPITLKVGNSQAFTVSGMLNGPYEWYKNETLIGGASGASYTYYAEAVDKGTNKIRVQTKDKLNGKTLVKEWTVNVYYNLPPIANAGPDQNLYFGNVAYLDGSQSSDPESQPLIYLWSMVSRPAGSTAVLDDAYAVSPSFTPDVKGAYTIRLIVNDGESNSASDAVVINAYTDFLPPIADAGADQSVVFGNAVHLDGSASSDPEHHSLTYTWGIDTAPAGSAAALDNIHSMTPSFMPDKKGLYVIRLVVNDGTFDSGVDWVNITIYNTAPVASAGDDITIPDFGGTANLDGSASYDLDGTTLTYSWTVTHRPDGSTAMLSDDSIVNPTFTPDKKGGYIIKLVVSDGDLTAEDTVTVTYSNHVPVAEAGDPIIIPFTQTAQLNGIGTDPDNDPLTYAWTITGRPAGSSATLSNAAIANPTFTPDKKGVYTFSLIVTDNDTPPLSSTPDTVTVTTTNHAPVAEAGSDVNILNKHLVQLIGIGTDIDSDTLTYTWTIVSNPSGSTAALSNRFIANPTFTPDKKGIYTLSFVVFDGEALSNTDTLQINATNNPPVAEAGANQTVHYAGRMVQLSGSGSSDFDGDPLTYAWTLINKPIGSTAALSSSNIVNPTITLDIPGSYVINLVVNDLTENSTIDTVTLTTYQETIVENWDDGAFSPWYESNRSGSWGTTGVSTEEPYSPSYSYWAQGAWFGGNTLMINRNFTNTWLIQIDFRFRGYATVIGSLKTSLYLNGSNYAGIWPDAGNTWYLKSYTPNMVLTKVGFYFEGFFATDGAFVDDIVLTVWD